MEDAVVDAASIDNGHVPGAAYAVLHLRPGASRELIEEAYWALIGASKASDLGEPAFSRRIDELNDAYLALTCIVSGPPPTAPQKQRFTLGRRRKAPSAPPRDLYELLYVRPEADPVVVRAAARHMTEHAPTGGPARDAVLRAAAVLSDAATRNAYDEQRERGATPEPSSLPLPAVTAHTAATPGPPSTAAAIASAHPMPKPARAAAGRRRDTQPNGAQANGAQPNSAQANSAQLNRVQANAAQIAPVGDVSGAVHEPAGRSRSKRGQTSDAWRADVALASIAAGAADGDEAAVGASRRLAGIDVSRMVDEPGSRTGDDESPASLNGPRVSVAVHDTLARIASIVPHRRPELEHALAEAENDRLLALRSDDDTAHPIAAAAPFNAGIAIDPGQNVVSSPPRPQAAFAPVAPTSQEILPDADDGAASAREASEPRHSARIVFESGPVAGLTLTVGGTESADESVDLHLATDDGAGAHVRVVERDRIYVLIHVAGPPAIVAGEEMLLPVLVLDDGDSIAYGDTVARFHAP